jgi:hypothetical protein
LGLEVHQLNRTVYTAEGEYNQLHVLFEAGYIDLPANVETLPSFALNPNATQVNPSYDFDANLPSLNEDARAYLHINCAPCHRPEGVSNAQIDFRFSTPITEMGICYTDSIQGDLGIEGAQLLVPGNSDQSLIFQRMITRIIDERMPPIGSVQIDNSGALLILEWIESLTECSIP